MGFSVQDGVRNTHVPSIKCWFKRIGYFIGSALQETETVYCKHWGSGKSFKKIKERRERHILQGGGICSNPSEIIFLLKIVRSGWTKPTELPRQPLLSWRWPRISWFKNNNQEWGHWAAQRARDGAQNWGWCQPVKQGRTSGSGDSICQPEIGSKWCYWQLIGLEPWGTVDCHLLHMVKAFGGYWGPKKVRGEMKWKIDQRSIRWWYSCVLVCMTIHLFLCVSPFCWYFTSCY